MTRIIVKELIWDDWNIQHIQKHDIDYQNVDDATKNLLGHQKTSKGRYALFCRCGTRLITVIVSRKGTGIYYVVSARDAAKKERRWIYEKEKS